MPYIWTEKDWTFAEIGLASWMNALFQNDEILLDVIIGDNGEGSGWQGHTHRDNSSWSSSNSDLGELIMGGGTDRGGVNRKNTRDFLTVGGGSVDTGAFPSTPIYGNSHWHRVPQTVARGDFSADHAGAFVDSDFGIGHDNVTDPVGTHGYYYEIIPISNQYHLKIYNWNRVFGATSSWFISCASANIA